MKKNMAGVLGLAVCLALGSAGCKNASSPDGETKDTTAPQLSLPAQNGETALPVDAGSIALVFSEGVQAGGAALGAEPGWAALQAAGFAFTSGVEPPGGADASGVISGAAYDSGTYTITLSHGALAYHTAYYLVVDGIKDAAGNALSGQPVTISFTTEEAPAAGLATGLGWAAASTLQWTNAAAGTAYAINVYYNGAKDDGKSAANVAEAGGATTSYAFDMGAWDAGAYSFTVVTKGDGGITLNDSDETAPVYRNMSAGGVVLPNHSPIITFTVDDGDVALLSIAGYAEADWESLEWFVNTAHYAEADGADTLRLDVSESQTWQVYLAAVHKVYGLQTSETLTVAKEVE
jgi:hypothetical protein